MKYKLTKKTIAQAAKLDVEYQKLYKLLLEHVDDQAYTKTEINYFLRKSIQEMKQAQENGTAFEEFVSRNAKKKAIEMNKQYLTWHEEYEKRMKKCDHITYAGFFSMVAYSLTLVGITAFHKGATTNWIWIAIPSILTLLMMACKIIFARKLKLPHIHVFGDIIIFALVTAICYFGNIYFIIFLWIYEVAYMIYLQMHIVEEDL